jgi:hypothetical protein
MNDQTPTWECPVCYKRIENWTDLVIDEYFDEVLQNTPVHISNVLVDPAGNITIVDENPDLVHEEEKVEDKEEEEELARLESKEAVTIVLDDDDVEVQISSIAPAIAPTTNNDIPVVECVSKKIIAKRKNSVIDVEPLEQSQEKRQNTAHIDLTLESDNDDVVEVVPSER